MREKEVNWGCHADAEEKTGVLHVLHTRHMQSFQDVIHAVQLIPCTAMLRFLNIILLFMS